MTQPGGPPGAALPGRDRADTLVVFVGLVNFWLPCSWGSGRWVRRLEDLGRSRRGVRHGARCAVLQRRG